MIEEFHRHGKSFYVRLEVLAQIKGGKDLGSKDNARIWLYTLAGMGYVRKIQGGYYAVTERGEQELKRHRMPSLA